MKSQVKVGSLVRLLDLKFKVLPGFMGLVTDIKDDSKARVHWMQGGDNRGPGHYWEFDRLQVVSQ